MPDFSLADILAAQGGAPGPVYEGGPTGNVTMADVLGPAWLDRARQQAQRDAAAYQSGGVPELMADRGETADLAGGFGGTTTPAKGIRAYHGSPYDFDKFDLSRIGTGEGAQAYGHGLYFAENPKVAQQYRDSLSNGAIEIGGKKIVPPRGSPEDIALAHLEDAHARQFNEPWSAAYQSLLKARELTPVTPTMTARNDMDAAIKTLGDWQAAGARPASAGRMYEVNINARPEQFIGVEGAGGTTSGQIGDLTPHVRDALLGIGFKPSQNVWNAVPKYREGAQELLDAGIPGIRYLDEGSRPQYASVTGVDLNRNLPKTSNYVVFNPDIVDIRKKWALLLAAMGGAGAPTMAGVLQGAGTQPPQQ